MDGGSASPHRDADCCHGAVRPCQEAWIPLEVARDPRGDTTRLPRGRKCAVPPSAEMS